MRGSQSLGPYLVRLVPVCTQTVSRLFVVELGKQIGHFVSYFNKTILCIMRATIEKKYLVAKAKVEI